MIPIYLGKVKLEWIVGTQADIQACVEEHGKWVTFIRQEERVIADWTHSETDLFQEVQVLQRRNFAEQYSMGY